MKEVTGSLFGNRQMKHEGQKDQAKGHVQQAAGDVEETAISAAGPLKSDTGTASKDDSRRDR